MTKADPIQFTRQYLDQFDGENYDGKGIKSAVVLTAKWDTDVIQGQVTDIVIASVRLHDGKVEELHCWPDNPPRVGNGHIFPRLARISAHNLSHPPSERINYEDPEA